jgi:hypothetical protein
MRDNWHCEEHADILAHSVMEILVALELRDVALV